MNNTKAVVILFFAFLLSISVFSCQKKTVIIHFETNEGTMIEDIELNLNDELDLSDMVTTRLGYTFVDWYTNASFTDLFDSLAEVTDNITLYARWQINQYTVTFETYEGSFIESQSITFGEWVDKPIDPVLMGQIFSGWYTNETMSDPWDFDVDTVEGDLTLYAFWVAETFDAYIETPQQLLNILGSGGTARYAITADLDFDGIDVSGSNATFSGTLDGLGHTISHINAISDTSKQGVFFKYLTGTIKNVKIKDSSYITGGEAGAFLVAHAHGGAVFKNIEFVNVSVYNPGAYGALLYGDNANDETSDRPVTIEHVTVINNDDHGIIGKNYTGGLIGYLRNSQTVNIKHVYMDSSVKSNTQIADQVAGSIIGRIAGSDALVNIEQTVIKGYVEASKNVGAIIGTSVAGAILNTDYVFVDHWTGLSGTTAINSLVGNTNGMTINLQHTYVVRDRVSLKVGTSNDYVMQSYTQGTSLNEVDVTASWFENSGFDPYFKWEMTTIVLNRESGPIVETGVSALTNQMKTTYLIGESLDVTGLVVKKHYSNGASELLETSEYSMDISDYNANAVGTYEIIVHYHDFEDTILITVVDVSHIAVETMYADTLYLTGEDLNVTDIIVKGILTDGHEIVLDNTDYQLTTDYNKQIPGDYDVTITFGSYEPVVFVVSVAGDPIEVVEGKVTITVDQHHQGYDGEVILDSRVFKTVKNALIYLDKSNLFDDVLKYIYVMQGEYIEKLTIDIPNIIMIGQSQAETMISYDTAAGTRKPEGGVWGTQGSAVVSIKSTAWGFTAFNLTFSNTFDYEQSTLSDKQAVAVVVESDMTLFYQVSFIGVQDTLYAKKGRQYYYQCYIEGAVDFIFGNAGPAFFEENIIHVVLRSNNQSGVIATNKGYNDSQSTPVLYGYVFYHNEITADPLYPIDSIDLGRPWDSMARVAYIDNTCHAPITTDGWTDMSGNLPENAYFYEYGNTNALDEVLNTSTYGKDLTATEVLNYQDKSVVFGTSNGSQTFDVIWDYTARLNLLLSLLPEK